MKLLSLIFLALLVGAAIMAVGVLLGAYITKRKETNYGNED